MQKRKLGKTGLDVTPLGLGAAQIGFMDVSDELVDGLLNGLLDAGLNVIDTAAFYQSSEEKIGRFVGARRGEYVLATKCGNPMEPKKREDWAPDKLRASIEHSLEAMKTDRVDVLLLHSCSRELLADDAVVGAMEQFKREGMTRFIGYSGDNEDLVAAAGMDVFDCLETSVSFCNQQVLDRGLPEADRADKGVFAKRAIANACWRDLTDYDEFYSNYAKPYAERLAKMGFTPESLGFDGDWAELSLRFTTFQPGVDVSLIGGVNLDHVKQNVAYVEKGPLPEAIVQKIREAWKRCDDGSWVGQT